MFGGIFRFWTLMINTPPPPYAERFVSKR